MDRDRLSNLKDPYSSEARMFALSEQMNQAVLDALDPRIWRLPAPGRVRTIAAIFSHLHNVRCKWVRLSAAHLAAPAKLDRAHCSLEQASAGLSESAERCTEMLEQSLGDRRGTIQGFRRDGWAPVWPVGVGMLCYMITHEAHHRGQVCLLAHQLGRPLPKPVHACLWNWERLLRTEAAADDSLARSAVSAETGLDHLSR